MSKMSLLRSIARHPAYAMATTFTMLSMSAADQAFATGSGGSQNIGGVANNLITQISSVGKVLLGGSFVVGVGMLAAGFMRLKQAADTQGMQVKYAEGLWRLAAGTGLTAIPSVSGILGSTFSLAPPQMSSPMGGANI